MVNREQDERTNGDGEGEPGVIGVLARTHVRGLREEEALVVAARLAGGGIREAGRLLAYSERQMRRRWDELMEIFLVPPGLPRHDDASAGRVGRIAPALLHGARIRAVKK